MSDHPYLAHVRGVLARVAEAMELPRNLSLAHDIRAELDPWDALECLADEIDRLRSKRTRTARRLLDAREVSRRWIVWGETWEEEYRQAADQRDALRAIVVGREEEAT